MNPASPVLVQQPAALETVLSDWRGQGDIALVPTMGNLHPAHLQLVRYARTLAHRVVVSIYVNPMQFGAGEDYHSYPRTPDADLKALDGLADLVYAPETTAIYPHGTAAHTCISVPELSEILCGASRPGHFKGVATVVAVLFNLIRPTLAVFGEKDYQQLRILQRMTTDLCIPVRVLSMPTVREADGLAMSSRNAYLNAAQRAIAPALYQTLRRTAQTLCAGTAAPAALEARATAELRTAGLLPEYVSIRDQATLGPPGTCGRIVLAAAHLGRTRLIDNLVVD